MKAIRRQFRVISIEGGLRNEDLHPVQSKASTENGFLKLFYARWPTAPRGDFVVEIDADKAATVYHRSGGRVARFIPK